MTKVKKLTELLKKIGITLTAAIAVTTVGYHYFAAPKVTQPVTTAKTKGVDSLTARFTELSGKSISERIAYWSEALPGNTKLFNEVLGFKAAPENPDTAPWVAARFNCTTFVETIVALARSRTPGDFYPQLAAIRYKNAEATFLTRNHFPEADWIPNGTSAGILNDATASTTALWNGKPAFVKKAIKRAEWLAKQMKDSGRTVASGQKPVNVTLPYVAMDDVEKFAGQIPNGTVANLVRGDNPKQPVLITHQGFILQKADGTYFRHSTPKGVVKTVRLREYLRSVNQGSKKWPVIGLNLNAIQS